VDATVFVAVMTSGTALAVSLVTFAANLWATARSRRAQVLDLVSRYRDPLLWATFDLRNRLYSIVENDALGRAYRQQGYQDWDYAQNYTLFLVCQYLGWVEIMRNGIQFLDLGKDARNRRLVELIYEITRTFATSSLDGAVLRVHRGEQRAIGELMSSEPGTRNDPYGCMGYAAFCARLQSDEQFAGWLQGARTGIENAAKLDDPRTQQLVVLQHKLTDLIDFLDPGAVRFPSRLRDRLALPSKPPAAVESAAGEAGTR